MAQQHDELFAKLAIQLKLLTPAQVMACRDVHAELESAGVTKLLAVVAVDQGELTRVDAGRIIDVVNKKYPGGHPALPRPAEAMAPKPAAPAPAPKAPPPAPRPAAPAPRGAARTSPRPKAAPAPRPAAKTNSKVLLIAGGAAAVVVIAVAALLMMGGGKAPPVVAKIPEKAPVEPQVPAPRVVEAPVKVAPEPKPEPKPEIKPAPPPPPASVADEGLKDFEERKTERKKEGLARLEEVRREIAQERKEQEELSQATRTRLAGRKVSLAMLSGDTIKDVVLKAYTFHGAELETGARITWDAVQPASLLAAADAMFDPQKPSDQFDRGRFFVARRMWNEAKAAFGAASRLGGGFESRVLEFSEVLDRLVSGQGGFRGSARRVGRDGVHLAWDFRDAKQLEDFTPGFTLAGRAAVLESAAKATVFLFGGTSSGSGENPLAFVGDITVDLRLSCDSTVSFTLFASPTAGFQVDFGPGGAELFRLDPRAAEKDRRKSVAKSEKVKLVPGKTVEVRLIAKHPRFRLLVDKAVALEADDGPVAVTADRPKGAFGIGIGKGKLKIEAPLVIDGSADAGELERRINDTEVMVRRALDPDLEQIERFRARRKAMAAAGETRDYSLSSDDPYFAFRVKKFEDITRYEELKKHSGGIGSQTPEQWKAEMDALIAKYPTVPSLYYVRAAFRHEHQDQIGSLEDVKKAVEIFPEFHEALGLQAEILLERQDAEAALQTIKRALEARPDFIEGYVIRARCIYATSPLTQAFMEDLEVARKLDPQDSQAVTIQRMLKYQRLGPRELGCRFDHETAHYRITSDISLEASKRYGENLEAAYRHYQDSFKGPGPAFTGRKPRVSIFQTAENYYTYFELLSEDRGESTGGVFWPSLNELVLFENGDEDLTEHVLYHEAVHQFMTLLTNRTPPFWFNEGIAEYMGSIKVKDGKLTGKGLVLRSRLPYAKLAVDVKADLDFEKIMNETPREFYSGNVGLKYAQAWAMIHFFYEFESGKYRPLIEEYFVLLRAGKTPRECFNAVFKAKAETLQKEWRDFTKGLK